MVYPSAFEWGYALVNSTAIPCQIVFAVALAMSLGVRRPKVFWGFELLVVIFAVFFKSMFTPEARMVVSVALEFASVMWGLRGSWVLRFLGLLGALIIQALSELPVAMLWIGMTGLPIMDYGAAMDHWPEFVLCTFVAVALSSVAFYGLYRLLRRLGARNAAAPLGGRGESHLLRALVPFAAVQIATIYGFVFVVFDVQRDDPLMMAVAFALVVLCAAVDVVLFFGIRLSWEQREDELRAVDLQQQVNEYLATAGTTQKLLQETAYARHDLRNHLQVVKVLCERGNFAQARVYLDEAARQFGGEQS